MTELATDPIEGHDSTDLCKRAVRALTESMTVYPEGGDIYSVTTESGNEYRVDAVEGRCTCPDAEYNLDDDERCKHERRVRFATGERAIPEWCDEDAINDGIGEHVKGGPVFEGGGGGSSTVNPHPGDDESTNADDAVKVATDGGVLPSYVDRTEDDDTDDDEDDDRPDDCECDEFHRDLDIPCWPCFHEGFEEPPEE